MNQRVVKLRKVLDKHNLDALLAYSPYNRRYLSYFTGTAGYVVITKQDAVFITDFRYVEQAKQQCQGFSIVNHEGKVFETVAEVLKKNQAVNVGFEQNHVTYGEYQTLVEKLAGFTLTPTSNLVEELRMFKDEEELQLIRHAAKIADDAFAHLLTWIKPGMTEIEVKNELEFTMRKLGASGASFDTIVASGLRSALPHGVASKKVIEKGDMITIDFGAIYEGYISDVTRTFAIGEPGEELRKIYEIVRQAQLAGVEQIRAGMTGKEADAICRTIIDEAGYGEYFGHSTGHAIGLEVHEGPGLSFRSEVELQPGMVVTVEPGIYVPGVGGVRIEDDIVITKDGNEIIVHSPKELIVLD
ncbi:M24 family metallopeptidase [Rubeoparvulum massiliense]|uniref:M24 family metallopeptidase n=1 Tax=Rubeoparvulum massiliense TaxID=1631346 RepID=UPI00065DD26D|nr:Xaa-Pro peptidase family protein [Rubeoparvulum massiliense]